MQTPKRFPMAAASLVLVAVVTCGVACGSSPTRPTQTTTPPPDATSFAGTWTGAITDFGSGVGSARVDLVGERGSLKGSWFALIGSRLFSGTVAERPQPGEQNGLNSRMVDVRIGCTSDENGGAGTMQLDGSKLLVTYFLADCGPGPFGLGTMMLTRQ